MEEFNESYQTIDPVPGISCVQYMLEILYVVGGDFDL